LATGGTDRDILIWEAPRTPPTKDVQAPSAAQRDAWWTALGGDAKGAYRAMGEMVEHPDHAVTMLNQRMEPVKTSDPATVAKLIGQLDSKTYAERAKAQTALEKLGDGAAQLLTEAKAAIANLEMRLRLEELLRKASATSNVSLQQHRAVAALEWIGTPGARALLRKLADGAPGARLTVEASAALKRLQD
jgi:hypothetical protein